MPVPLYPLSAWMDNVALAGLCSKETLWATYELACSVIRRGIPGDLVECGVYGGANSAVMARAIVDEYQGNYYKSDRRVHCFDTFAGIPQAGPEDHEFLSAGHEPGLSTCDLESCKAHMVEWSLPLELFVWHEGDFAVMVPLAPKDITVRDRARLVQFPGIGEIALLRLDGDLYRSTKVCMEHLYPLVSSGGWVIVDDWSLSGARKAVEEFVVPSPIYFQRQK